jgi:peptidoglycan/xylan/chitin deacetylase (PgdA/CDA1 family)
MSETEPPSYYPYVPLPDRQPLRFPDGAQLALILTINIEYWEKSRPGQKEPLFTGGPMTIPHALPGDVLDTANWTWREYGQRVGVWRMIEMFDSAGVKPSCTINGMTMTERRPIVDACNERGWELVPHNWAQNDLLAFYAHNPDDERAVIRRTLDIYENVVGRPAKAWLSSAIRGTAHTPAFLKEFGLIAYCDYLNDDQPYLIHTKYGPIVCVPYSNDINDFNLFARGGMSASAGLETLKICFDQLYAEGAKTGRIMNVGLHPHVMGQAHRIGALRDFVEYATCRGKVWLPSREEIANWYLTIHDTHIPNSPEAAPPSRFSFTRSDQVKRS